MDKKSKANEVFLGLAICCSLWSGGYAMMLTSDNINIAFFWRGVSVLGYCYFNGFWLYFAYLLNNTEELDYISIVKFLAYVPTTLLFIANIFVEPYAAMIKEYYGWIDVAPELAAQIVYTVWAIILDIAGVIVLFLRGKHSKKNRIKKQNRIILITCIISIIIGIITDLILPLVGIVIFPTAVITGIIALGGICYAIRKHKMMLTTPRYISEYIFNTVIEPIFILDENFNIQNCNEMSLIVTNYEFKEIEGKPFSNFIVYENFDFNIIIKKGYVRKLEVNLHKNDGSDIACELSSTVIFDEYKDILGVVVLLHDISERKKISELEKKYTLKLEETNMRLKKQIRDRMRAEEQISHFVYFDPLTELPNRKMMLENLNMLLENKDNSFLIIFIDLDGFKSINDNYGHLVGDKVLKNVADSLKNVIREESSIFRIGGDEFIIILRNIESSTYINEISESIQKALEKPFIYNEESLMVGASIGISIFPNHGDDSDTLIKKADLAMYEVKENGGYGYAIYSSKIKDKFFDKLEMKKKINKAIEENEFIIYYQPIMDLRTMKVLATEALIRWKQGDKIISPLEFIPIAKSVGEITSIDNWVLKNACMQCKRWNELGSKIKLSVNASYAQIVQTEFVSIVQNILETYSLPAEYLNIEITEDEVMEDFHKIIDVLTKLKSKGVKISLDDFGTGYSSISYASKLPVDKIKIDRTLIMNLEKDDRDKMIVKAIINTGHSLGLKLVAEGIETQEQFRILKEFECDFIQGYLIGRPMEASEFEENFIDEEVANMKI